MGLPGKRDLCSRGPQLPSRIKMTHGQVWHGAWTAESSPSDTSRLDMHTWLVKDAFAFLAGFWVQLAALHRGALLGGTGLFSMHGASCLAGGGKQARSPLEITGPVCWMDSPTIWMPLHLWQEGGWQPAQAPWGRQYLHSPGNATGEPFPNWTLHRTPQDEEEEGNP